MAMLAVCTRMREGWAHGPSSLPDCSLPGASTTSSSVRIFLFPFSPSLRGCDQDWVGQWVEPKMGGLHQRKPLSCPSQAMRAQSFCQHPLMSALSGLIRDIYAGMRWGAGLLLRRWVKGVSLHKLSIIVEGIYAVIIMLIAVCWLLFLASN